MATTPDPSLPPSAAYVYERLPPAPTPFTSDDVVALCGGADQDLDEVDHADPAAIVGLLTARDLVKWNNGGFVKRAVEG